MWSSALFESNWASRASSATIAASALFCIESYTDCLLARSTWAAVRSVLNCASRSRTTFSLSPTSAIEVSRS